MSQQHAQEVSTLDSSTALAILAPKPEAPAHKRADIEVSFTPSTIRLFYQTMLGPFSIWDQKEDGLSVQMPHRSFPLLDGREAFFNLVRAANDNASDSEDRERARERAAAFRPLRRYIVNAYRQGGCHPEPIEPTATSPLAIYDPPDGVEPTRVADVSLAITPEIANLLYGLKLVGFSAWDNDDSIDIQVPMRNVIRFGVDGSSPILRGMGRTEDERDAALKPLRTFILDAYWKQRPAA